MSLPLFRFTAVSLCAALLAGCASTGISANEPDLTPEQVAQLGWGAVPHILAHIKAPVFPNKNFPITDYGAKADGATDCTDAIRRAVEACHAAGGGHVLVPDGTFLTGPIHLLSNVDLHLADKATLQFSTDVQKYLPLVRSRFEGVECMNFSPLIYAFEQENIGVTGRGTLDGGGQPVWTKATLGSMAAPRATHRTIPLDVPVEQRLMGLEAGLRPNFIVPYRCQNVIIDGLTIHNSPMWETNPVFCTNVIVRNLTIDSHGANNDGCDPDSCKYVLIEGCSFETGDDSIAIKCGKDEDGWRANVPTEFVIVRNCKMTVHNDVSTSGHGGVTLGSECSPAIRNVFVENCVMGGPQASAFYRFKDSPARGGTIENAYMRNVQGTIPNGNSNAALLVQYNYMFTPGRTPGDRIPILRNVYVSNVTGTAVPHVVLIQAGPTAVIENLQVMDSTFTGPKPAELEQNPGKVTFTNVKVLPSTSVAPAPATTPAPSAE